MSALAVRERATRGTDPAIVHRRRWWTLAVMCLCLLLISIDNTILNVALPTLSQELGASASELQWIVDSYVLVFAGLLLAAGALGDRYGRRGALTVGILVFGAGSVGAAVSSDPTGLIVNRAVMGVGGALIMPATLSIITSSFTDRRERAKAIGIWAGVSGLGVVLGPLAGGWLLERFWWGSVFLVNLPVLALGGVALVVPTSRDPSSPPLDVGGVVLSFGGLATILWALVEAPHLGWTSGRVVGAGVLGAVLLASFAVWERSRTHPLLDVGFFRDPRFSVSSAAITLTFFAMFGSSFLITQYMQMVLGHDALAAGVRYLPLAAGLLLSAPASARLVARFGTRVVATIGMLLVAVGLSATAQLSATSPYRDLALCLVVTAIGVGLTMAPATDAIMGSVPARRAGVGSAMNDTTRQLGGALGVAVLGSVMSSVFTDRFMRTIEPLSLPTTVTDVAADSIGSAVRVAGTLPDPAGAQVVHAARGAFVEGMSVSLTVAAGFAVLGAVVTASALPGRSVGRRRVVNAPSPARPACSPSALPTHRVGPMRRRDRRQGP